MHNNILHLCCAKAFFLCGKTLLGLDCGIFMMTLAFISLAKAFFKLCLSLWNILGSPMLETKILLAVLFPYLACWVMAPCFSPGIVGNIFILGYA